MLRKVANLEWLILIEIDAKSLKIKDPLLVAFWQTNPPAKSLSCLEVGDVVFTRRVSLAEY